MLSLEKAYDNKTGGRIFYGMINKEKRGISLPLTFTMIAAVSFILSVIFQLWYLIPLSVISPLIAVYFWKKYLRPENSRTMVLGRVLQELLNQHTIDSIHLPALKAVLSEDEMIALIKKYEKNIPISEVLEYTENYFHDFREYKARQIYININNKK